MTNQLADGTLINRKTEHSIATAVPEEVSF